jgi:SAM-dependent methyltransferase
MVTFRDWAAEFLMEAEARLARNEKLRFIVRPVWWVWGTYFDFRHNVETTRRVPLQGPHLETRGYEAFMRWYLTRVLPPSSVNTSDVFLDAGSGKGRAVLFAASHYPFQRVIGVELSASLHRVATENKRRFRGNLAPIELINDDVLDWEIPDDVTVLFMFNPFSGSVFERFMASVRASLERCPREFRVVYENPQMHQLVIDAGFKQVRRLGRVRTYR